MNDQRRADVELARTHIDRLTAGHYKPMWFELEPILNDLWDRADAGNAAKLKAIEGLCGARHLRASQVDSLLIDAVATTDILAIINAKGGEQAKEVPHEGGESPILDRHSPAAPDLAELRHKLAAFCNGMEYEAHKIFEGHANRYIVSKVYELRKILALIPKGGE